MPLEVEVVVLDEDAVETEDSEDEDRCEKAGRVSWPAAECLREGRDPRSKAASSALASSGFGEGVRGAV
jgi:hypothetical protein